MCCLLSLVTVPAFWFLRGFVLPKSFAIARALRKWFFIVLIFLCDFVFIPCSLVGLTCFFFLLVCWGFGYRVVYISAIRVNVILVTSMPPTVMKASQALRAHSGVFCNLGVSSVLFVWIFVSHCMSRQSASYRGNCWYIGCSPVGLPGITLVLWDGISSYPNDCMYSSLFKISSTKVLKPFTRCELTSWSFHFGHVFVVQALFQSLGQRVDSLYYNSHILLETAETVVILEWNPAP